jgi:hypothetical protein
MPQQILVRVRDISKDEHGHPTELTDTERVITFRAYQYTQQNFKLLEQVIEDGFDENGQQKYKAVPGNPNLPPEFRTTVQSVASHAADSRELEQSVSRETETTQQRRGPGRPKANQDAIEHTA